MGRKSALPFWQTANGALDRNRKSLLALARSLQSKALPCWSVQQTLLQTPLDVLWPNIPQNHPGSDIQKISLETIQLYFRCSAYCQAASMKSNQIRIH